MSYHATVREVYREAALTPTENLCCIPQTPRYLPELNIPDIMHQMNYGCGSTVHLQDMQPDQTLLYVGVGGGLEVFQLAYFARRPGAIIAVEPVAEMRDAARVNLEVAAETNSWFDPSFIEIRDGDALDLPVEDGSIDMAAQNCLFNIFQDEDLTLALREMYRVLADTGRLVMSDPISPEPIPHHLRDDDRLRAQCISGCQSLEDYLNAMVAVGFGAAEVRSRRPYRLLDAASFDLDQDLMLETVEVAAFKTPMPEDGPCIFTGRCAIYGGPNETYDDGKGHVLVRNMPHGVCDKTARALATHPDITVTDSTWHYQGDGCC